jgi:iron complex outermembrane receptor protein
MNNRVFLRPMLWVFFCCVSHSAAVNAEVLELKQVTVTASKYEEDLKKTPSYILVISKEEIENAGVTTVNEAIMKLGGVAGRVSDQGGAEYKLDMMGFGDTAALNTAIIIDGVPLREADSSEARLSGIPIDQVERIEVQKGAASVVYGEGAVAGVINIITKASSYATQPNATSGSASVGQGSYGAHEEKGSFRHVNNGLSINISGLSRATDGYRENSSSKNESLSASAQWADKSHRIGLYTNSDNAYSRLAGPFYTIQSFESTPNVASTPYDWSSNQTIRTGAFVESELAGTLYRLDANQRKRNLSSYLYVDAPYSPVSSQYLTTANFLSFTGNRFNTNGLGDLKTIAGIESYGWEQSRKTDATSNNSQYIVSDGLGYFAKVDQQLKTLGMNVIAGIRSESVERNSTASGVVTNYNKNISASELGLSKQLDANQSVYVRIAKSFRMPNADEFACALGYPCSNTNTLLPQTSHDKEIGWKFIRSNNFRLSSRIYQSSFNNEIAYDPINYLSINLSPTTRTGIDLNIFFEPVNSFYMGGSLGLRKATFDDGTYAGKKLPMAPSQVGSAYVDWKFLPGHTLGGSVTWTSKQFFTGNFSNDSTYVVPSYSLLDLRYRFQTRQIETSLSVHNVLDKTFYSYGTMYTASLFGIYPEMGRTFMARLKYSF